MTEQIIYWGSTLALCALYLASATLYVARKDWTRKEIGALGYPTYLVSPLAVAKFLAVLVIAVRPTAGISDLAYAGIFFHLILSGLAHFGVHRPRNAIPAFIGLILLVTSFISQNAVRSLPSPYGLGAQTIHTITF
ncbi:DoxX family protein [Herbaspirillum chlorophenolicum]|uniref:DoxX family protein n=1 Tax=Herbaspirillum chlorophenolicum TaxID=211589 RepID=UPI0009E44080|nr:DoxX family protein [Herbaspirillum chlorophenolicum]